jgi:hypothetical protein
METNWNQLIERYLQHELSEEGKMAFEQELQINPELQEELEMHRLIQSAAKRASQRTMIQQTGKLYLRNLRIKQFTIGIVGTAIAVSGIVYWVNSKNDKTKQTAEHASLKSSEENSSAMLCRAYEINRQSNQPGGKSSLIQPTDWKTTDETESRFASTAAYKVHSRDHSYGMVTNSAETEKGDSLPAPRPTVAVLGYSNEKQRMESSENQSLSNGTGRNMLWVQKYDSVGKFNDLYCGYALVMDNSKFGFVDPEGKIFIPLIYDQLVVTTNIKSSKQKNRRQKKKVLYIPKRSGKDVKDCDEQIMKVSYEIYPAENSK